LGPPDGGRRCHLWESRQADEEAAMTARPGPTPSSGPSPTVDEIFVNAKAVAGIDELAQDGIFEDDAELDDLLADLRRMRRSSIA
jgi:hypothetical protein